MKVIALVILVLLLLYRIKTTPSNLSKRIWIKRLRKSKDNLKNKQTEVPLTDAIKGATLLIVLLFELFLIIFYAALGCSIGTTTFIVLSALQIITCIWATKNCLKDFEYAFDFDGEVNDRQFYRWFFLLNVVLDYIYYPLAIYMLLK